MLEGGLEVTLRSGDSGEPDLDHLGGGPGAEGSWGKGMTLSHLGHRTEASVVGTWGVRASTV